MHYQCECFCNCCPTQFFLAPGAEPAEAAQAVLAMRCPGCGRPLMPRKLTPFGEAEWLACDDATLLAQWEDERLTDRKLRLFAVACSRHVWDRLGDPRSRAAVEVAERFADGRASARELARAFREAHRVADVEGQQSWEHPSWAPVAAAHKDVRTRYVVEAVVRPRTAGRRTAESAAVAALFREVVGNPFRPVRIDPAWLAWEGGTVRKLAESIYEEKGFERMAVLGDALEEAGCADGGILGHCRGPGPHARGCWVVDLLLGKG